MYNLIFLVKLSNPHHVLCYRHKRVIEVTGYSIGSKPGSLEHKNYQNCFYDFFPMNCKNRMLHHLTNNLIKVSGFIHNWYENIHPTGNGSEVAHHVSEIHVTPYSFLYGEYAAATVMVSFCVLLGKVTTLQLIIMALLEVRIVGNYLNLNFYLDL